VPGDLQLYIGGYVMLQIAVSQSPTTHNPRLGSATETDTSVIVCSL